MKTGDSQNSLRHIARSGSVSPFEAWDSCVTGQERQAQKQKPHASMRDGAFAKRMRENLRYWAGGCGCCRAGSSSAEVFSVASTGAESVKLSTDSAGMTICLFPVKVEPAKPAPPPARAPMAAPLPPPAIPPMTAPSPAPPPLATAVRLPLPFSVLSRVPVEIAYEPHLVRTRVRRSDNWPSPLTLPLACATTTTPEARAPLGMMMSPLWRIFSETVAEKAWLVVEILEPSSESVCTLMTVPAGRVIVTGCGGGGGGAGAAAGAGAT